jgi:hypothetical protein
VWERRWVVVQRCRNYSAFSGYHFTPSDWSHVHCKVCGANGRTKAKYVEFLRDAKDRDLTCRPTHCVFTGLPIGSPGAMTKSIE